MSKIRDKLIKHLIKRHDEVYEILEKMHCLADSFSNDITKKQMAYIILREILYLLQMLFMWTETWMCILFGKIMSVFGY